MEYDKMPGLEWKNQKGEEMESGVGGCCSHPGLNPLDGALALS